MCALDQCLRDAARRFEAWRNLLIWCCSTSVVCSSRYPAFAPCWSSPASKAKRTCGGAGWHAAGCVASRAVAARRLSSPQEWLRTGSSNSVRLRSSRLSGTGQQGRCPGPRSWLPRPGHALPRVASAIPMRCTGMATSLHGRWRACLTTGSCPSSWARSSPIPQPSRKSQTCWRCQPSGCFSSMTTR